MKKTFLLAIFFIFAFGQVKKVPVSSSRSPLHLSFERSPVQTVTSKELHPQIEVVDYKVSLVNLERINPENDKEAEVKRVKTLQKFQSSSEFTGEENAKTTLVSPNVIKGFSANDYDGCYPPDNALAYSPVSGYLVSVTNCQITYYDKSGQIAYKKGLKAFFNNNYTAFLYDPVILYDPQINRFIMVILHGTTPSVSKVLLCVSQSSNPLNGWWTYEFPGDPAGTGVWFDYPKLAVSDQEIFITGNQYDANDNFSGAIIYQITKSPTTTGSNVNYLYWTGLSGNPGTLLPVSGASANYGPGIYLVSVNSVADQIYLYDITDYISNNPTINAYSVNVSSNITIGGNAAQQGTSVLLDVGNTRALSGFYQNGVIHFVHNNEYASGYNGIMYHRITLNPLSDWSQTFGATGFDYNYPSVAWIGKTNADKTAVINFVRSGSSIYPEHRVVICDDAGSFSSSVQVKAGTTYVDHNGNISAGQTARWGDYTGITRDYSTNTVWIAGHFGTHQAPSYYNVFNSWLANIGRSDQPANLDTKEFAKNIEVFPNPAPRYFRIKFKLTKPEFLSVDLYSLNGKRIQTLLQDKVKPGTNVFSFDTTPLAPGEYFLQIKTSNEIIKNEKIIIY